VLSSVRTLPPGTDDTNFHCSKSFVKAVGMAGRYTGSYLERIASCLCLIQKGIDVPDRLGNGFSPGCSRRSGEAWISQDRKVRFHGTNVKPPSFGASLTLDAVSSIVRLMIGHSSLLSSATPMRR
jgi:hypothetical protein